MQRARPQRPSPAMVVALLALFTAMGGVGYAALKLPKNSVGSRQIKNNSVTSAKVKDRSLLAGDFKAGQLPAGAQGPQGVQGPQGTQGAQGATGNAGQDSAFKTTLRSGDTETGVWGLAGATGAFGVVPLTFRPQVPTSIPIANYHYVPIGMRDGNCPADSQAGAGHVCVYEDFNSNMSGPFFRAPPAFGGAPLDPNGILLYMTSATTAANARGTWAVTAP